MIRNLSILLMFLLLGCSKYIKAAQADITPLPSWILVRPESSDPAPSENIIAYGYFIPVYDEQVQVALQSKFTHVLKQIVNETGVQSNSNISINFSGDYQQLHFHTLNIIRDGKIINKLDRSKIKITNQETELNNYQYHGFYQATILLDDVRKGDKIDLAYTITGENPIFKNKYNDIFSFVSYTYVCNYYISIIAPKQRKLLFKGFNGASAPETINTGNNDIYTLNIKDIKPFENAQDYSPSWYIKYPFLEVSEYQTWEEVAQWGEEIMNHYQYTLSPALKEKTAVWEKEAGNDHIQFMEKAVRFVQNDIRYLGIEMGEYTHRPHPPAETYQNRYGDCKDKSILLTTILRANGIEAYMVLVNTNQQEHITEHIPGADKFNHVIVKAIANGKTFWIDPTIPMQGGDMHHNYIPDYGKGLVIKEHGSGIEYIKQDITGSIDMMETIHLPSDNKSKASISVATTYMYNNADDIRSSLSVGQKQLEQEYEKYYTKLYGTAEMLGDMEISDYEYGNRIIIKENYAINNIWTEKDGKHQFDLYAKPIHERLTDPANAPDDAPIALVYPLNITYTAVMEMPSEWDLDGKPFTIDNESYTFSFEPKMNGKEITMRYTLITHKDHIPIEEVNRYKQDYKKIYQSLFYSFTYNQQLAQSIKKAGKKGQPGIINWVTVFMLLLSIGGFMLLFRHFNKKEGAYMSQTTIPDSISGWLYLLGFVLIIRTMISCYYTFFGNYYSTQEWMILGSYGNTGLQLYLIISVIIQTGIMISSFWLLYWFFTRRDVFPGMLVSILLVQLGLSVVTAIIASISSSLQDVYPDIQTMSYKDLLKNIVSSAIWVTATLRSEKIKQVFIRPYRYIYYTEKQEKTAERAALDNAIEEADKN